MNSTFLHMSPAQKGAEYFGVVPVPVVRDDGVTILTYPNNKDIQRLCDRGRGLILVDETRSAPAAIRAALLSLLQERLFGDGMLPPGVRVFGASNSAAEATNGRALSAPEANRVCHLNWNGPSSRQMMSYGIESASKDPFTQRGDSDLDYTEWSPVEEGILAARSRIQPGLATTIFGFTEKIVDKDGNDLLHSQPKAGRPEADGAWCSRRSWMNVLSAWTSYEALIQMGTIERGKDSNGIQAQYSHEDPNLRAIVAGLVGEGASALLWHHVREQDLPDFAEWLDDKIQVHFDTAKADRTWAIFNGAAAHILTLPEGPLRSKRAKAFWGHALKISKSHGFELVQAGGSLLYDRDVEVSSREALAYFGDSARTIRGVTAKRS
jgi:hypothetical protein